MNVLIIEDEKYAAKNLKRKLHSLKRNIQILEVLESVEASLNWLQQNEVPDLIFSDIQLADGLSFDIFQQVSIKIPIVFTTAYDEYAIRAFDLFSIDYLMKPIQIHQLQKSLEKFELLKRHYMTKDYEQLLQTLSRQIQVPQYLNRLLVYVGANIIPISTQDIAYFYADEGDVYLITHKGKRYFLQESLNRLEQKLNPKDFHRVNRQFLIGVKSIERVQPYYHRKLLVQVQPMSKVDIVVSKERVTAFKRWLAQ